MTPEQWAQIRHFKSHEFDSPDAPGSGERMDFQFLLKLDAIRDAVGIPLVVDSGVRTPDHNASLSGSVDGSAHISGFAADIALYGRTSGEITWKRALIMQAAKDQDIVRIGIGKHFLHLDTDPTKPAPRYWLYD